MSFQNRQWLLQERPTGGLDSQFFKLVTTTLDDRLEDGQVIIKNIYALCAPSVRNWMREVADHHPAIPLGSVVKGPVAGQIIRSAHPDFPVGTFCFNLSGWQDYALLDLNDPNTAIIPYPPGVDPLDGLTIYGINPTTAYFGVTEYGKPVPGEVMLVSGAAGSTGSVAAQIGKILGCRVIGLAGSDDKCRWLVDECGIDAAINYRSQSIDAELTRLCPEGLNIFFDNVGGDILKAVLPHMAAKGRVVLCGQIAGYTASQPVLSSDDLTMMVYRNLGLQGYNLNNFIPRFDEAITALKGWFSSGRIVHREDIREGFEQLPQVYAELFTGDNNGTLVVKIADPERQ